MTSKKLSDAKRSQTARSRLAAGQRLLHRLREAPSGYANQSRRGRARLPSGYAGLRLRVSRSAPVGPRPTTSVGLAPDDLRAGLQRQQLNATFDPAAALTPNDTAFRVRVDREPVRHDDGRNLDVRQLGADKRRVTPARRTRFPPARPHASSRSRSRELRATTRPGRSSPASTRRPTRSPGRARWSTRPRSCARRSASRSSSSTGSTPRERASASRSRSVDSLVRGAPAGAHPRAHDPDTPRPRRDGRAPARGFRARDRAGPPGRGRPRRRDGLPRPAPRAHAPAARPPWPRRRTR